MKLTMWKIKQIGILANELQRFYSDCRTYAAVQRSRDIRRRNIKGMNADAIFFQEEQRAREALTGDLTGIQMVCGFLNLPCDLTRQDINEFLNFCADHQLSDHGSYDAELTDKEKGIE